MSSIRKHSRLMLVAVSCAVIGAGASAIASAGATTQSASKAAHSRHALGAGGLRRIARRAVHGQLMIPTKQGMVTVTFDRGKVESVSGQQLTISEGTKRAGFKTVTLTIPTTANVRDNRHTAALADLKAGQRVIVVQAPKRTLVVARTPKAA
jgi:hypothetical protein